MKKFRKYYAFQSILNLDFHGQWLYFIGLFILGNSILVESNPFDESILIFTSIFTAIRLFNDYVHNPMMYLYPASSKEHSRFIIGQLVWTVLLIFCFLVIMSLIFSSLSFVFSGKTFDIEFYDLLGTAYRLIFGIIFSIIVSPLVIIRDKKEWYIKSTLYMGLYYILQVVISFILTHNFQPNPTLRYAIRNNQSSHTLVWGILIICGSLIALVNYKVNSNKLDGYIRTKKV